MRHADNQFCVKKVEILLFAFIGERALDFLPTSTLKNLQMNPTYKIFLILIFAFVMDTLGEAPPVIDTTFNSPGEADFLPVPWRADSSWADIDVSYDWEEEDGHRFLSIKMVRQGSGFAQIATDLPSDSGLRAYRLEGRLRVSPGTNVRIGIRQRGAPYRMVAECRPQATGGWIHIDEELIVTRSVDVGVGLWIQVRSLGTLDIASLKLTERDAAEADARHLARIGGPDVPNLVRISRFPLGLPVGWKLDREVCDTDVVQIGSDLSGPSGYPSLFLNAPVQTQLFSVPFDSVKAGEPHRLSFYISGDWRGRLAVLEGERVLAEREISADTDWRRIDLAFTPTFIGPSHMHAMRVLGQGHLRIDGMQVTEGSQLKPYTSRNGAEVQLAMHTGDAAVGRCQFLDEEPLVSWAVTGATSGDVLRISATDQDGRSWSASPIVLEKQPMQKGLARLSLPSNHHAALRVTATIDNSAGADELVFLRVPRPRFWGVDAPDSPFGIHVYPVARSLALMKALGYNWVRLHDAGYEYTGWSWIERQQGAFAFRDDEVGRYRKWNLSVLGQLGSAPEWASHASDPGNERATPYFRRYFQPKSMENFGVYVSKVTDHYRQDIRDWFVWNEPWLATRWAVAHRVDGNGERYLSSDDPQRDFVELMKVAHTAAKAVDPELRIIGINSSSSAHTYEGTRGRSIAGSEWTSGVVAAGGLSFCDDVDFHCYVSGVQDSIIPSIIEGRRTAITPIEAVTEGASPRVWLTEGSPSLPPDETRYGGYRLVTLDNEGPNPLPLACRLVLWELGSLVASCERSFLYSAHTTRGLHEWPGNHMAIVAGDGSPHPAALAVAAFHHLVEGLHFLDAKTIADGLTAYRFVGSGREAAIILDRMDGTLPDLDQFHGVTLYDAWGNPNPTPVDGSLYLLEGALPVQLLQHK